ncbi:alpha/beta hydrolase family protein [Pedobacter metabolipauper]|uniref:Alpha-beta hydrolase superfamily lysophospholipase n=1 Tax=Pedobacter metabolipauper TaxID=425513 RepID=A0A4R6STN8_9SPHI|nr:alpha/beta fold hydrolase [Pedobacter metabolipauper]TDQ08737.1 alpha-beta hydrolase superfamily lysophospholipase [Pedobacter metabolipauper]
MPLKEQFTITGADGKIIFGDYTIDDRIENKGLIIFIHGFKGFKDWGAHHLVASFFAENGYPYLKFNLSHSGVTAEKPADVTDMEAFASNTFSKELFDIDAVLNYAAQKFNALQMILIGHSRGGGLAILKAAADSRISKLITWSSISDFSSLWKKEQEAEWMEMGKIYVENARTKEKMPLNSTLLEDLDQNREKLDILNAAEQVNVPWLILHGDDDVNVDFSVAQQLAQKQLKAKIQKIEGANHVYGASHPYTSASLPAHLQQVCGKTLAFLNE